MDKLPEDFKKKWVDALRSGEFEQCHGKLHDGIGYCCLGVACKILGITPSFNGEKEVIPKGTPLIPEILTGHGNSYASQDAYNPLVNTLAGMNDGDNGYEKKSFLEIADYIEANL